MLSLEQTMPMPFVLPWTDNAPGRRELSVRGLTYEVSGRRLIDSIDLDLGGHGASAVLGANGAGKSLFLRLIHGLIDATSGSISWGGEGVGSSTRNRQAMVFQKPVLLRRSVAANLDFVLKERASERNVWLSRVGLLDKAGQPARKLSGGEQQRLALARALATKPEVLLLDEPTASLDPASAKMVEELIVEAASSGIKVIFVTHSRDQAERLAHDVLFFYSGRLVEQTSACRFFAGPQATAARAYLQGLHVL